MYECQNCGGNLKFDIDSQQLKCDYCLTVYDPYQVIKENDAVESEMFDATIFTCPQCGGEILSTDNSAAEFCSFCGASTILSSRISRQMRPAHIIPFKQNKNACKKAYLNRIKRAPFAPRELKDEKCIDSFRGIYMPYWSYTVTQQGPVSVRGQKSYTKGNYRYTDYYDLTGDIDAAYNHLSYDASSSFSDNISEQIAPFHTREMKEFTPSFLSGFYADTADVSGDLYKNDAVALANSTSCQKIKKSPAFSGISIPGSKNNFEMTNTLHTWCEPPKRVMYPVWFMSYRKDDRVAYATVNGQTGKVSADIPVDLRKYTLCSVLLALPIFVFLNLFFTIRPKIVLSCAMFLAAAAFFIYIMEILKIYHREKRSDDRGYLARQAGGILPHKIRKEPSGSVPLKELLPFCLTSGRLRVYGFTGSLAAMAAAIPIWIFNPVSDLWYYAGTIAAFIGILFTITDLIRKYNILATRKLPQFDRRGGDDNA